jgi:GNAT superfamily N-acetyltransferase
MVHFRLATRSDVPAIVALLEDDEITRGRERLVPEDADAALWRAFEEIDADQRNELIVADRDGEVVGTCQLTFTPGLSRGGAERMTIEAVRVARTLRGQGVGRDMMRWALDRARERGCALAQLTTDRRRTDAQRFYESLGFTPSHIGMKRRMDRD